MAWPFHIFETENIVKGCRGMSSYLQERSYRGWVGMAAGMDVAETSRQRQPLRVSVGISGFTGPPCGGVLGAGVATKRSMAVSGQRPS